MADLFEVLNAAIAARPAGPDAIGRALGMAFRGPAEGSNEVFLVLASQRSRSVDELTGAELRVRRATGAAKLMLLKVDRLVRCASAAEILRRFGQAREVSVPHPPQPADSPIYSIYPQDWGQLRIGLQARCVVSIVADFNE